MKKHGHQSIADFYQQFQAHVQMCEEMDVQLYEPALALSVMAQRGATFMTEDDKQNAHRQAVAMRFIRACGHGEYLQHLRNSFLDGKDIYPKRISDAFTIMDQRVPTCGATHTSIVTNNNNKINTGIAFPTCGTNTTTSINSGSTTHSDITTTSHNQTTSTDNGAYRSSQPTHMTHTHSGMIFSVKSNHNIPTTWILLDNQATTDIFGNANLLNDIHEVTAPLYIHGITGVLMIKQQGTLPGHGTVWYHPQVSINILSMAKLKQQYHITYDSGKDSAFIVKEHDNTQTKYIFHESDDGLYYHEVNNTQQIYITTVTENKQKYSQNDVKRADGVRALQKVIGHPTAKQLSYLLDHHLIPNSPFTSHDVRRAEQIYGPDLGNLKGKTTRRNPPTVDQIMQQCPDTIIEQYGNNMLSADVMHVNGIPFFITRSRHIHFGTVDVLPSLQAIDIGAALRRVVNIYARGGFQVTTALVDGAFAGLHDVCNQLQVTLNTTSRDEHVGDVERYIRTVKERMRGISNTIPFKRLTRNMVMELAKAMVYWLNSVPSNTGVSPMMSPRTIIMGQLLDYQSQGISAVKAELQQLHDLKVMEAMPLTTTQKWEALGYLMFLKRKCSGEIKARGCADGRPQRAYIPQEDARAPTVSTEAVFMTAVIDAMENRTVAVVDIPGAFMQADMDPGVYMHIDGAMAELLMEIDHDMYHPHMVMEKGKPVIYVELLKALYGTLRAARLFWETLSGKLQEWGFTLNAYDSCVANKYVDGQQCTITWHVDDLKISHVDEQVVRSIIQKIQDNFGQHSELSMHIGKRHDYLGMILDFTTPGILEIDMSDYIQVILQDTPANLRGTSMVPAAKHLFTTRPDAPKISPQEQEIFHHLTMQLMYLSQRGRPDIRTAVAFLSSRVANPDQDDYMKLGKVIKYLENTIHLTLRLQADETNLLQWWVDAAYATHPDMKGHTGATFTMGHRSIYSNSLKQKLVARSSTEAELVGVHDILPQILWTRNFLMSQGYPVQKNVVYQDNMSAMLLENNGRKSSTKRTKHIELWYFFIHDQVQQDKVLIQHCPTLNMRADFFTKPLQGMLFYRLRDLIMNLAPENP